MIIIGLTGGIGMGKSAVAAMLKTAGLLVYNADQAVHDLLGKKGKAVKAVAKLFPEAFKKQAIDRKILGRAVFGQPQKLKQLEKILHPLVRQQEKTFLQQARKAKKPAVVLEIPLLFETGGEKRCAITLLVTASAKTQTNRVLRRKGMTKAKLAAILARQMPDAEKRRRADYVIRTDSTRAATKKQLQHVLKTLNLAKCH